ncbi:MAG: Hpt domain-containing protein, partial [Deltaproteobacteria bacterium]|nr:Hpt domain-containing protein [Deltaproteobacteria bacterium]
SANGGDLVVVRRQVHTLKGNCALFGIEGVAAFCHDLETRMTESNENISASDVQALGSLWQNIKAVRVQLVAGAADGVQIDSGEYAAFIADLQSRVPHDLLLGTAVSWRFEPASQRLELLAEQVRALASRLGKADVEVIRKPTNLRLSPRLWAPFWSAFAHVVRNTVDHGLETAEARAAAGKAPRAKIALAVIRERDHVSVTISDDGPGIAWSALAAKAKSQGLPHLTQADLEEALFTDGVSSRDEVTSTSGRGVGMGAVRDLVRGLGGEVTLTSEPGRGTTFRFSLPLSILHAEISQGEMRPRVAATG